MLSCHLHTKDPVPPFDQRPVASGRGRMGGGSRASLALILYTGSGKEFF